MEGIEPKPGVTRGFSYSHWPSLPSWGQGQIPRCWSCGPEGWRLADSISSKCAYLLLSAMTPLPQKGTALEWEGPQLVPDAGWGAHWGGPGVPVRATDNCQSTTSASSNNGHPRPVQISARSELLLFTSGAHFLYLAFALGGSCRRARHVRGALDMGQSACWGGPEKLSWAAGAFSLPPLLVPESEQVWWALHKRSLGSCSSSLSPTCSKPGKETCLPSVGPWAEMSNMWLRLHTCQDLQAYIITLLFCVPS